jgi:DNA-binding PadR family transcriptional regulator
MSKGDFLGEFEQLVLLAVLRLGSEAYGLAVRREIALRTGRDAAIGAVYATLDRLEEKGLVTSQLAGATPTRGGRAKRCFHLTAQGERTLRTSQKALARMLDGLSPSWRLA